MSCQSGDIDADRGRWLENRMYFHYSKRWAKEDLAVCQRSKFTAYISSKSFIVSGLTFKSLIHFEFLCMVLENVLVSFFYMQLSSFPTTTNKWLSFLHYVILPPQNKGAHRCVGLSLGSLSCSTGLYFCFCANTILS